MNSLLKFDSLYQRHSYLYVFLSALAIRLIAVFLIPMQLWEYEVIAVNILNGKGFIFPHFGNVNYYSYCEPLYPFLCAVVYFITNHSIFALAIVQAIFSSLIALVIYFCAEKLYNRKVALLAGLLVSFHPGLIIYTLKQHPLIYDSLFISLVILVMFELFDNFGLRNIVAAGLISGLCVLTRPTILLFLPLSLIYILLKRKVGFRKFIISFLVFFILAGSVFLPWTMRNYFVQKELVLTRSNGPFVFWLGNNPNFSGSATDKSGRSLFKLAPKEFQKEIENLDEMGQNRKFLSTSLDYIKEDPFAFTKRIFMKFFYFWWFTPQAGAAYPGQWFISYKVFYSFLLFFGLAGIFFTYLKTNRCIETKADMLIFIFLAISFTQSIFYIETRHRWAIEPLFIIFSAAGIYSVLAKNFLRRDNDENN